MENIMPKDTPFFKFDSSSWLGGSIQFTSLQCKGLFIDLCALYWESNEPVKIDNKLRLRIRVVEGELSDLIRDLSDLNVISVSDCGVTVPFLDELREERVKFLERCSQGGKNSTKSKGKSSNKKEERRKKSVESRKENVESRENKEDKETFDIFRKAYLGNRKGLDTEFSNFKKKHKDWKQVLPELKDLLTCQINQREALRRSGQFVPEWKHLSTWINNRCWEEEYQKPIKKPHSPF